MSDFSVAPVTGGVGRSGYIKAASVTSANRSVQRAAVVDTVVMSAAAQRHVTTTVAPGPILSQTITDLATRAAFTFVPGDYSGTILVNDNSEYDDYYNAFYADDADEVPFYAAGTSADPWVPTGDTSNFSWGILPPGQQIDTWA